MCIYLVEVWAWLWATLLLTCLTLLQLVTWVTKLYLVAVPFYRYLLLAVPPISFCHHYFFLAVFWVLSSSFSSLLASQKLCSLITEGFVESSPLLVGEGLLSSDVLLRLSLPLAELHISVSMTTVAASNTHIPVVNFHLEETEIWKVQFAQLMRQLTVRYVKVTVFCLI